MKQNKSIKYSYLAGVIDSDGCIAIKRTKASGSRKTTSYSLQMLVNQVDGRMIDFLYGAFGGNITKCKAYQKKRQEVYRWYVTGSHASYIIKRLIPFLRIKKKQAEIALRFQTRIEKGAGKPDSNWRCKKITDEELKIREHLYQLMRQEKANISPCAAVETKRSEPSKKVSDSPNLNESKYAIVIFDQDGNATIS